MARKNPLPQAQVTSLWDFPSQTYGSSTQGDPNYAGATPSYVIWNCVERYSPASGLVLDPMCGSGTTLDVARDLGRRAVGYDLNPTREDIGQADARQLPLGDAQADLVFLDPPYSTHIHYSDHPQDIGNLPAATGAYYEAMAAVLAEVDRVMRPGGYVALYVCDSFVKGKGFYPLGFELFALLSKRFTPIDVIAVTRRNRTLGKGNYRKAALEGKYYLRGFNYLFLHQKPSHDRVRPRHDPHAGGRTRRRRGGASKDGAGRKRRDRKR